MKDRDVGNSTAEAGFDLNSARGQEGVKGQGVMWPITYA